VEEVSGLGERKKKRVHAKRHGREEPENGRRKMRRRGKSLNGKLKWGLERDKARKT